MKIFKKLLSFVVVFMVVMVAFCNVSFAATVGQQLTSPEKGWSRYTGNNPAITYTGKHTPYDTGMRIANGAAGSAKFSFYGTKLRIISFSCTAGIGYSSNVEIKIDGVITGKYSSVGIELYHVLAYEKTGLPLGTHTVEITPKDSTTYGTLLFSVDIDNTGYLLTGILPTNLSATTGNKSVTLKWDAAEKAASYNIKRSTTVGGPYTTIATSSAITCTDSTVTNGITYYYVVTAIIDGTESTNSNEASATIPLPANKLKLVLEVKGQKRLSVSDELSDNTEMDWVSSDALIATVDTNGMVKALKPGNTVITCTSKDKSYTEVINVLVVDLEYQLAVDLTVGDTCRLTIDDLKNTTAVTWSSYDPTIATVSAKGKVTAVSDGLTYVVATDKDGKEIGRIYIRVR